MDRFRFDEKLLRAQLLLGAAQLDKPGSAFLNKINPYQACAVGKTYLPYHQVRDLLREGIDDHVLGAAGETVSAVGDALQCGW